MRYFIIQTDPAANYAPDIINWFGKIDKHYIRPGVSYQLPMRQILPIRSNPDTFFTDVISFPFFLVSTMAKDVVTLYEPKTVFKELVLLDAKNKLCEVYHLPILNTLDCLSEKSEFNLDHSVLKHAIIDVAKTKDRSLFFLDNVKSTYVVARVDFVESLLRRGARGIGLQPVDTV